MKICSRCEKQFDSEQWRCPFCSHEFKRISDHLAFAPELAEESEGFEASYFEQLAGLEKDNFWFRARNQLLVWAFKRYFPRAESFLEIGCGTGFVLSGLREAFPHLKLHGSEVFVEGLSFAARRLPGVELFQMDARRIPFAGEFDVVGAFDVLEHIKEDEVVLAEMYRATRKGGGVIMTVPQHPFLWSQSDVYARHVRRYRAAAFKAKVEAAGFTVEKMTSFVSLLLPMMLLSRLRQNRADEYDPLSEFNISPKLNALLETILKAERGMIRAGISFPAGGSLLVIGRRKDN